MHNDEIRKKIGEILATCLIKINDAFEHQLRALPETIAITTVIRDELLDIIYFFMVT